MAAYAIPTGQGEKPDADAPLFFFAAWFFLSFISLVRAGPPNGGRHTCVCARTATTTFRKRMAESYARRYEIRGPPPLVDTVRRRYFAADTLAGYILIDDPECIAFTRWDTGDCGGDGGDGGSNGGDLACMASQLPDGVLVLAASLDVEAYPRAAEIVALAGGSGECLFDAPVPAPIVAALYFPALFASLSRDRRRMHALAAANEMAAAMPVDDVAVHFTEDDDDDDDGDKDGSHHCAEERDTSGDTAGDDRGFQWRIVRADSTVSQPGEDDGLTEAVASADPDLYYHMQRTAALIADTALLAQGL